jgi:hypothetical protein
MIKVMNLISILIAPATVILMDSPYKWVIVAISLVILAGAVTFSKRGGVEMGAEGSTAVEAQRPDAK